MQLSKKSLSVILLTFATLSSALAYSLWLYTVQNQMSITTYKEVQVEYPLGTKITGFDWGDFNKTVNTKTEVFWLRSFSNTAINVTYQVSFLDTSCFTTDCNTSTFEFTTYNQVIPFEFTLELWNFSTPAGDFSFDLEFGEE